MTSLKTSIKTITYLSDIGCLEIQGASLSYISLCAPFLPAVYSASGMRKGRFHKDVILKVDNPDLKRTYCPCDE
ncbi:hypothetical protein VEE05_28700 [Escherichia coli]|nr:hypothetical protein VEE05_28700 [Escherichia coli]